MSLSEVRRGQIIALLNVGLLEHKISAKLKVSKRLCINQSRNLSSMALTRICPEVEDQKNHGQGRSRDEKDSYEVANEFN